MLKILLYTIVRNNLSHNEKKRQILDVDVALLLLQKIHRVKHVLSWHVKLCKDHKK